MRIEAQDGVLDIFPIGCVDPRALCRLLTRNLHVTDAIEGGAVRTAKDTAGAPATRTTTFAVGIRRHVRSESREDARLLSDAQASHEVFERVSMRLCVQVRAGKAVPAVLIVPTGVGAAIGGYAGDALPVARAMGGLVDRLVTHPNVLNGAMMYWPMDNAWYVEGHALDRFAAGECGLRAVHQNRIGIVIDRAVEHELKVRHLQVADAAQATLGLDVAGYMVTEQYLGVALETTETGASTGTLSNPDTLLKAADILVNSYGCEAIAVVARFPDEDLEELENYRDGVGVDALAGVEAVISHYIENTTVMDVRAADLDLESLQVSNYMEALGAIAAHKSGVAPASLLRDSSRRTKELHYPPE
eukprot:jgi/Pico_ML_1/52528/g3219.t1